MATAAVKEILREIDALVHDERLVLERELTRRLEKDWKSESGKARKSASNRKIDQLIIDRAIERHRYRT